jgi:predicted acetyltransferase
MNPFSPPADDQEMDAIARMQSWAFASPAEDSRRWIERWGAPAFRVLRENGRPLASLKRIEMGQYFGARSVPMVGIAAVAVPPEERGRGAAARLMEATVRELHAEGVALSALYPATQALYRRSGYEQAGSRWEVRARPDLLRGERNGVETEPIADGRETREVYARCARMRDGWLDRAPYNWSRIEQPRGALVRGLLLREEGRPVGYLWLTEKMGERGIEIAVADLVVETRAAAHAALRLLRAHGTLVDEIKWFGGAADPLLMLLPEQRCEIKLRNHWMLRIVDLSKALSGRGYRRSLRGTLHLRVDDPLLPANAGDWTVTVEEGRATVARGGRGDLETDCRGLAALYSGFLPAEQLRIAGRLEGDDEACALATAFFSGATPSMPDMF